MKKIFGKTVCVLLVAAFALPFFGGIAEIIGNKASASGDNTVYYNRTYDENRYDYLEGVSTNTGGGPITLESESGNNFVKLALTQSGSDCYIDIPLNTKNHSDNKMVFEISLKFDANHPTTGTVIAMKDENSKFTNGSILQFTTSGGKTYISSCGVNVYEITGDGQWVDFVLLMDTSAHTVSTYVNGTLKVSSSVYCSTSGIGDYISTFRVNLPSANGVGKYYCFDDIRLYGGDSVRDLNGNMGIIIDSSFVDISEAANMLVMKVGVDYAFSNLYRVPVADGEKGAPVKSGDTVYVPFSFIAGYLGYEISASENTNTATGPDTVVVTAGSTSATVNGTAKTLTSAPAIYDGLLMIDKEDVTALFGANMKYDDMGLIIISEDVITLDRSTDMDVLISIMNSFIFDFPSGDELISDMDSYVGLTTHPRLLVDQDRFDEIRAYYEAEDGTAGYNSRMKKWTQSLVNTALNNLNNYFDVSSGGTVSWKSGKYLYQPLFVYDSDGNVQVGVTGTDPYGNYSYGDGYDVGGRSSVSTYTTCLKNFAFAWQMTGEQKYADAFYLFAKALGEWVHWGPGHFLNCADGAAEYALGFDWIYHAFDSQPEKQEELAEILYRQAIYAGYGSFHGDTTNNSVRAGSGGRLWHTKTNNWVTVCASGMVLSCLAIAEYDDLMLTGETQDSAYVIRDLLTRTIKDIPDALAVYAPDGAYTESASYWAYGTNTFFLMCEGLVSATGTEYGFMDTYGIDKTCYFALNIESSNYKYWNYHDGGNPGAMATQHFSWVGQYFGDGGLVALRYKQIDNGKSFNIIDVLYYAPEYDGEGAPESSPDYYAEGIDTFLTRSSWESGAIFTGIHGGENTVPHGNYDAGNFIIYKGSNEWICDLGSDNYNLKSYFGNAHYYRLSAEGANTVVLTGKSGLPYGVSPNGNAKVTEMYSGEYGSYAVLDMNTIYGSYVSEAKRGLLFTNDRNTIVVQDQMSFTESTDLYWFAHTKITDIEISPDGRTAYLRKGTETLRATIISSDTSLTFEIMDTYTFVLDTTYTPEEASSISNGQQENDRSQYRKLAISATGVQSLDLAVVFEFIDYESDGVGYSWTDMSSWTVSDGYELISGNVAAAVDSGMASIEQADTAYDLITAIAAFEKYINDPVNRSYMSAEQIAECEAFLQSAHADADALLAQEIIAREDSVDLSEYSYSNVWKNVDFDTVGASASGSGDTVGVTAQESNGNKYMSIYTPGGNASSNRYIDTSANVSYENIVIEFDYAAFGDAFAEKFQLMFRYASSPAEFVTLLELGGGDVSWADTMGEASGTAQGLLKLGEWNKIAVVLSASQRKIDIYVNDLLIASDFVYIDQHPANAFNIRINYPSGNVNSAALDNIRIYKGTAPRDLITGTGYSDELARRYIRRVNEALADGLSASEIEAAALLADEVYNTGKVDPSDPEVAAAAAALSNKLESIGALEEFGSLVATASDSALPISVRDTAAKSAMAMLDGGEIDEGLPGAAEAIAELDAALESIGTYKLTELADALPETPAVSDIEAFLSAAAAILDEGYSFDETSPAYAVYESYIGYSDPDLLFTVITDKFDDCTTKEQYAAVIGEAEEFLESHSVSNGSAGYLKYLAAVSTYNGMILSENTAEFERLVNYAAGLSSIQDRETALAEARNYLTSHAVDTESDVYKNALAKLEEEEARLEEDKEQDTTADANSREFIRYAGLAYSATTYSSITRYIDAAKAVMTGANTSYDGYTEALAKLEQAEARVEELVDAANAYKTAVDAAEAAADEGYSALLDAVDTAQALSADADRGIDGVVEAGAKLSSLRAELAAIEERSSSFIASVIVLEAMTGEERFNCILDSASKYTAADVTYPGVTESYGKYSEIVSEYNDYVEQVNEDVESTIENAFSFSASVPETRISATIPAIIKKLHESL